ncbi:MAG: B12-binding domain-containing radical SAM protein [Magnetococcales bacterium]|nr:B12-binding domain-containing radical SAM protein [Magnetococcales bacterium]
MKIVFPYTGAENMGIGFLSAVLRRHGYETQLAFEPSLFDDTKFLHIPAIPKLLNYNQRFADYLVSLKPDVLAFSVFTMNYAWALEIAARVKEKMDVVTVFGGVHVQALPERVLIHPQVDFIILGEGEYPLLELVQSLERDGAVDRSILNLGYVKDGVNIINPVRPLEEDLDTLPYSDREIFEHCEDYGDSILYMCGRGCGFHCTFCANQSKRSVFPNKKKWVRMQSVDRSLEELRHLRDTYHPKSFLIIDDVFVLNKKWMREFCERYPDEVGVPFQVTGYPSVLKEEDIRILKQAGCFYIQVGIQSLNPDNRRKILKRYETNEHLADCIKWCRNEGMGISVDYIFFPWEANEKDQLAAARFFLEHTPTRLANFYLTYLPGTEIIQYALEHGYLEESGLRNIEMGVNAHYHAGGEFQSQKQTMKLLNNFYVFFILIIMFPRSVGQFLFRIRAYRYARFLPKTLILILKEIIIPLFSMASIETPNFKKYVKYYWLHLPTALFGIYKGKKGIPYDRRSRST